jgi:hypothetical protein
MMDAFGGTKLAGITTYLKIKKIMVHPFFEVV